VEHTEVIGAEGHGIVSQIGGALEFADKLLQTNPAYAAANPLVAERVKEIKAQNPQYVAHEYFNRDWHPMHFSTMAEWLGPAKLSFACSAVLADSITSINLTPEQQAFLTDIPDKMFRESVRDFMINQQFRRDYWVKGPRQINALQQVDAFQALRLLLVVPAESVTYKVKGVLGEGDMDKALHQPIVNCLADHQVKSFAQLQQNFSSVSFEKLREAVVLLVSAGYVKVVQDACDARAAKATAEKLNNYLLKRTCASTDIIFLASPVTGAGIMVNRFEQLFILAFKRGFKEYQASAEFVWGIISKQGNCLVKDGKTLETAEANVAELTVKAKEFMEIRFPVLDALGLT